MRTATHERAHILPTVEGATVTIAIDGTHARAGLWYQSHGIELPAVEYLAACDGEIVAAEVDRIARETPSNADKARTALALSGIECECKEEL